MYMADSIARLWSRMPETEGGVFCEWREVGAEQTSRHAGRRSAQDIIIIIMARAGDWIWRSSRRRLLRTWDAAKGSDWREDAVSGEGKY